MLTGSCLCGAVKYQLTAESPTLYLCHCSRCRKASGSAFNAVMPIKASDLAILQGQEQIKVFAYQGVNRHFCGQCGSPLFSTRDHDPDHYRLRVGGLDSAITPQQKIHIFVHSKANWDEICDNNPTFAERAD